jgi:hypothetical protein
MRYALVDAIPMKEAEVDAALRARADVRSVVRVKEGSYDFPIAFTPPAARQAQDHLRSLIHTVRHVVGVELIQDWNDHSDEVRAAKGMMISESPDRTSLPAHRTDGSTKTVRSGAQSAWLKEPL